MSTDSTQKLPDDPLALILARLDSIDDRLSSLEEKVEKRLQDTRPIWEAVNARLERIDSEVDGLRSDVGKGFRNLERRLDVVSADINQVRADLHDHSSRIEKLEGERA